MSVSEVISVVAAWLTPCWQFFLLPFPLFNDVTIADIYIGLALAAIGIRVIKRAIDSPESPADGVGSAYKGYVHRKNERFLDKSR